MTKAFNFSRDPADLVSFAYCVKHAARLTGEVEQGVRAAEQPGAAVAWCRQRHPGRRRRLRDPRASPAQWARRADTLPRKPRELSPVEGRGAQHRGRRLSTASRPGTLIAYAYCVTKAPRLVTVSKRAELAPGTVQTRRIACPHGSSAYSGGFDGNLKLTAGLERSGGPDLEAGGRRSRMACPLARRLGHGELARHRLRLLSRGGLNRSDPGRRRPR